MHRSYGDMISDSKYLNDEFNFELEVENRDDVEEEVGGNLNENSVTVTK